MNRRQLFAVPTLVVWLWVGMVTICYHMGFSRGTVALEEAMLCVSACMAFIGGIIGLLYLAVYPK